MLNALAIICINATLGALLVHHASVVQVANLNLAPIGGLLGGIIGLMLANKQTTLEFAGGMFGALGGLQFFTCYPCDGSNFLMPFLSLLIGSVAGWIADRVIGWKKIHGSPSELS